MTAGSEWTSRLSSPCSIHGTRNSDWTQVLLSSCHFEKDGSGLGMSISLRLARMMGGDIKATSTIGKGSQFIFSMMTTVLKDDPVVLAKEMEAVGDATKEELSHNLSVTKEHISVIKRCGSFYFCEPFVEPRILVVDDNSVNARLLCRVLVTIQKKDRKYPSWVTEQFLTNTGGVYGCKRC